MSRRSPTALVQLYRGLSNLVAPLAARQADAKLARQGVARERLQERRGTATLPRPEGRLIWFHAASVGESLSVLRLIEHMGQTHPRLTFLITSGTATSAEIVARRLPPRTRHQFAPLDAVGYLRRFLDHWRPDAAVFVESELWPHMLIETARRGIPLALVNARISDRSANRWRRVARSSGFLLSRFALIHCQDARTAAHLAALGRPDASVGVNLKSLSGPLPFDAGEHARMRRVLQGRPVWLASSTHPGEDEIVLGAHAALQSAIPGLILILVPRHPERAATIETLIAEKRLSGQRRSTGGGIAGDTQVYLADTLGETGLWYALCPLTCLCGSFTPVGGHNPFEPAHAGSAILHGPHYANFAQVYAEMDRAGAAQEVADAQALTATLRGLLTAPRELKAFQARARAHVRDQAEALEEITEELFQALGLAEEAV